MAAQGVCCRARNCCRCCYTSPHMKLSRRSTSRLIQAAPHRSRCMATGQALPATCLKLLHTNPSQSSGDCSSHPQMNTSYNLSTFYLQNTRLIVSHCHTSYNGYTGVSTLAHVRPVHVFAAPVHLSILMYTEPISNGPLLWAFMFQQNG